MCKVDVQILAGWLLFSGAQAANLPELLSQRWYQRIKKADYVSADGYLDGLIITSKSFDVLLPSYQDTPNCLLLLDPPYLCTTQGAYAKHGYFGMTKFLTLMHYVKAPYIFFSSTRSELLDYMDYLRDCDKNAWARLGGFELLSINTSVNYASNYQDNMLVKI